MTPEPPPADDVSTARLSDAEAALEPNVTDEKRLHNFTTFFKNYMSVSAVLAAAAPIPVALFGLIPAYESQKKLTATLSSLAAFLALAYIFFNRAPLGRVWFGAYLSRRAASSRRERGIARQVALLPLGLIAASFASLVLYLWLLHNSVNALDARHYFDVVPEGTITNKLLSVVPLSEIPSSPLLLLSQLGFFVFAEAAFIVMALREYTQDLLGISDRKLILEIPGSSLAENAARRVYEGNAETQVSDALDKVLILDRSGYAYEVDRNSFGVSLARLQASGSRKS
jgi:hypothetical protein